jgi:acetyltransferase
MEMEKFFYPQSLAVLGVSDSPHNLGKTIIENLDAMGYTGRVYPVGRGEKTVSGKRVYAGLNEIPETPDLAVFLIPARIVLQSLEACGRKGVRHVVIETGGFSELGGEGEDLEKEIIRIARQWGIAFIGPNCVGVVNAENGLCLPFVPFARQELVNGSNGFISQSGGLIHELMRRSTAENLGLSKMVSIGNKLMLNENDILEFLIEDPKSEAIGVYLEGIADGRRLMDLAAGTTKPVIALKGNTSPASRNVASFHTAALLGDDTVVSAAFKQAGIHRVDNLEEMVECFKIFSLPPMKGPNLFALSRSGGQSVVLADNAYRYGFHLPDVPAAIVREVQKQGKAGVIRSTNPLDLGDVFNDIFYLDVVEMALQEADVDGVVFFYDYPIGSLAPYDIIKGSNELSSRYRKPVVLCLTPDVDNWFNLKYSTPLPFFNEPERALSVLRRSLQHHERISGSRAGVAAISMGSVKARAAGSGRLASAEEISALLEGYEIPTIAQRLFGSRDEGLKGAEELGYPVALKQAEPLILHKTEAGAIRLDIRNGEELAAAMTEMPADLYLLQKMAPEGVETIVGGKWDNEFGPVIVFGLGGIFVEVLKDVTMRVAPVTKAVAGEMIEEIKGSAVLRGVRGRPRSDVGSLAKVIAETSRLLIEHPEITSLDINPLRVLPESAGCLALDIKIELSEVGPTL